MESAGKIPGRDEGCASISSVRGANARAWCLEFEVCREMMSPASGVNINIS